MNLENIYSVCLEYMFGNILDVTLVEIECSNHVFVQQGGH